MIVPSLALGLLILTQDARGTGVKIYSLANIRLTQAPAPQPSYGGFLPHRDGPLTPAAPFFSEAEDSVPSAGDILDVVRAALGSDSESATLAIHDDRLVVQAAPAQHAIIAAVLRDLEAAAAVPVKMEVHVVMGASPPWPARRTVLTKEEADAAVKAAVNANVNTGWSSTLEGMPGRVVEGGPVRQVSFIATFRSEIAKKAQIAEPVIETIRAGTQIVCQAFPSPRGDSIYLCAVVNVAEVLGSTSFATRASDVGSIDVPKVQGIRLASSAHVPAGGALALSAHHPEFGNLWVLCMPRWGGTVRPLGKDAGAKPVLFFRTPSTVNTAGRQLPRFDEALTPSVPDPGPRTSGLELMKGSASALSKLTRTPSGFVLAVGDAEALDAFMARVIEQEKEESKSADVEIRIVKTANAAAALDAAAPVHESAQLSVALRASAGCVLGHEETAVEGYHTQVAEESAIATPDVKNLFRGLVFRARALDIAEKRMRTEVEVLRCDFGPRERTVSDATDVGDLERIPRRHTVLRRVVELPWTTPILLGDLGVFGSEHFFAIAIANGG